jgi:hypothetical protein
MLVAAHAHVLDRAGDGEKKEPGAKDDDQHAEQRHVRLPHEQRCIEAESQTLRLTHKCDIAVQLFGANRFLFMLFTGFISRGTLSQVSFS